MDLLTFIVTENSDNSISYQQSSNEKTNQIFQVIKDVIERLKMCIETPKNILGIKTYFFDGGRVRSLEYRETTPERLFSLWIVMANVGLKI